MSAVKIDLFTKPAVLLLSKTVLKFYWKKKSTWLSSSLSFLAKKVSKIPIYKHYRRKTVICFLASDPVCIPSKYYNTISSTYIFIVSVVEA